MPADLIDQLERYGTVLRDEMAVSEEMATPEPPTTPASSGWQRSRLALAAALLLVALGGWAALSLAGGDTELVAVPVDLGVEGRATDTPAFLERLASVDFEKEVLDPRDLTAGEVESLVSWYGTVNGASVVPESAEMRVRYADGPVVVEFDVAPSNVSYDHCRVIGEFDGSGLDFGAFGLSMSCWNPDDRTVLPTDVTPQFSYGCEPAVDLAGMVAFGKGRFTATVDLPLGSPGIIVTLESGELVVIRASNGLAVYAGPPATQMELFYGNGDVHVIDTTDCR